MTNPTPISVRRYGERGPDVLLLHGGPGAPGSMADLARDLADIAQVWEPLQRSSDQLREGERLSVDRHAADLAEVAPKRAQIVGHSWGAMLGLSYAALYPDRVSALAIVGCGTYSLATRAQYQQRMESNLTDEGRAYKAQLKAALERASDQREREAIFSQLGALNTAAQFFDPLAEHSELASDLDFDPVGHQQTWEDVLRLQAEGIEPARFSAITARVLMLHGENDPHPGVETFKQLARIIPLIRYVQYPMCGHEPWKERHARRAFLTALRGWIVERAD